MENLDTIFASLLEPKKIVITMHQKPDPDAMGSSLGLFHYLKKMGHDVTVISPTNWADFLKWMPSCDQVIDFESNRLSSTELLKKTDWLFCLDFNHLGRTRNMEEVIMKLNCKKILIDHHREPQVDFFDYGISNIKKSSTAEMVYDFIIDTGGEDKIDKNIAICLYAGVMSDTGSFRFSSTSASVHLMVAKLKAFEIDHPKIHTAIYDNFLENRLRFIGHVLSNRLEVFYEYNTALISIPKNDILRFHIKTGDTEGLVNYPLSIQGIEMAALLIDRDEERKWSFRSKETFDCNTFARRYFQGGGHYNAAGGGNKLSFEENVKNFKSALREFSIQTTTIKK